MISTKIRTGECSCGGVTIETIGEPSSRLICNCNSCKKRTGSDYSNNVYFRHNQLNVSGQVEHYTRRARENRFVTNYFCNCCGMTLY